MARSTPCRSSLEGAPSHTTSTRRFVIRKLYSRTPAGGLTPGGGAGARVFVAAAIAQEAAIGRGGAPAEQLRALAAGERDRALESRRRFVLRGRASGQQLAVDAVEIRLGHELSAAH